jgi:hypothetical protein
LALTVDEQAVRAGAQIQLERVARRIAAEPVHKGMPLLKALEVDRLL